MFDFLKRKKEDIRFWILEWDISPSYLVKSYKIVSLKDKIIKVKLYDILDHDCVPDILNSGIGRYGHEITIKYKINGDVFEETKFTGYEVIDISSNTLSHENGESSSIELLLKFENLSVKRF